MNADISIMAVSYINSNKEQPLSIQINICPGWNALIAMFCTSE